MLASKVLIHSQVVETQIVLITKQVNIRKVVRSCPRYVNLITDTFYDKDINIVYNNTLFKTIPN